MVNLRESWWSRHGPLARRRYWWAWCAGVAIWQCPGAAAAYIGPGAGFAFLSSAFVLLTAFVVAFAALFTFPIRAAIRYWRRRRLNRGKSVDRVVVVGLDGMDPKLTRAMMDEGMLPNLTKMAQRGAYATLGTTAPSLSPVAWSSFATGVGPARHNIFDFLGRSLRTYRIQLSSALIRPTRRVLRLGRWRIPLGRPQVDLLRKSEPFWKLLGEHGIFGTILRVPITFPPRKFYGAMLAAMCVPDLKGSQGSFTAYSSAPAGHALEGGGGMGGEKVGGVRLPLVFDDGRATSYVPGPANALSADGEELRVPFHVLRDSAGDLALEIAGKRLRLRQGEYTPWIHLRFNAGLGVSARGICRFYLMELSPEVQLYCSPVHVDPEKPALPISHPPYYATYLAKVQGSFGTLGLMEDTWALNEEVIDEDAFLAQAYLNHEEREQMFFHTLRKQKKGAIVCVFDATDRISHMFYRCLEPEHPANRGDGSNRHDQEIKKAYMRMDQMIGRVVEEVGDETVLMVMSDHGFASFQRCVNLNSWLQEHGYLVLHEGGGGDWFQGVDWERTRAYTFGLGGVYLNLKGREACGQVEPGREERRLRRELADRLTGLRDTEKGAVAIRDVFEAGQLSDGPYVENGPDLIIGYNAGYRASWGAAIGAVTEPVIFDNTKKWSGDHCIDPRLVPGVFFCNRPISVEDPTITDVAPTVMALFGVTAPPYMEGRVMMTA